MCSTQLFFKEQSSLCLRKITSNKLGILKRKTFKVTQFKFKLTFDCQIENNNIFENMQAYAKESLWSLKRSNLMFERCALSRDLIEGRVFDSGEQKMAEFQKSRIEGRKVR